MQFRCLCKNILTLPFCSEFHPGWWNDIENSIWPISIGLSHFFFKNGMEDFWKMLPGFRVFILHCKTYSQYFLTRLQVLGLFIFTELSEWPNSSEGLHISVINWAIRVANFYWGITHKWSIRVAIMQWGIVGANMICNKLTYQSGHTAVRDGWGKHNAAFIILVLHINLKKFNMKFPKNFTQHT